MAAEVVLTAGDLEALGPILEHARTECGAATRTAVEGAQAMLGQRGPGAYPYGDLLELREVLEGVRDDRCPVDRHALEALLSKF
ncbi:MAG TPA: hypothetical protein VGB42_00530 [Candidatus Thermoplasmatota archaeon]